MPLVACALVCVGYIYFFSMSIKTIVLLVSVIFVYIELSDLSRHCLHNLKKLQLEQKPAPQSYILKNMFGSSVSHYFCLVCLALFPVRSYSLWLLLFFPAVVLFSVPMVELCDSCSELSVSKVRFWIIHFTILLFCFSVGRGIVWIF